MAIPMLRSPADSPEWVCLALILDDLSTAGELSLLSISRATIREMSRLEFVFVGHSTFRVFMPEASVEGDAFR
jgi:hypothetical protein